MLTGRPLDALSYWEVEALCRPMPDIGEWLPAWHSLGEAAITVESAQAKHAAMIGKHWRKRPADRYRRERSAYSRTAASGGGTSSGAIACTSSDA